MNIVEKPRKVVDLAGRQYGKLSVVGYGGKSDGARGAATWWCVCACGNVTRVRATNLVKSTGTRSCGCLVNPVELRHGMVGTPEYRSWYHMWDRCTNPRNKRYEDYRHRVPPESWRDFKTFYKDVGPRPGPQYSLDRIDNDLPYGPDNVRWALPSTQRANQRRVTVVLYEGKEYCLSEACTLAGLSRGVINRRMREGMTMTEASNGKLTLIRRST